MIDHEEGLDALKLHTRTLNAGRGPKMHDAHEEDHRILLLAEGPNGAVRQVLPKIGDRYGELTIIRLLPDRKGSSGSKVWECQCDCGGLAFKTSGELNRCVRDGKAPSCRVCRIELRRASAAERGKFWTFLFRKTGNVWPESSCTRLANRVADDLEAHGHRAPCIDKVSAEFHGFETESEAPATEQRLANIYPLTPRVGAEWLCLDCLKRFARGFGCVECLEPVCTACVGSERHLCLDVSYGSSRERTLKEIGDMFGVCSENIRAIQERALRKLRLAWGANEARAERRRGVEQMVDSIFGKGRRKIERVGQ
jgi:hypothetical protein